MRAFTAGLAFGVLAFAAAVALAGTAAGRPPPEWAASAGGWPAHNHDLANTRATMRSPIDSSTVARLKVKWRFPFAGTSSFGAFASTPIVLGDTVYLQDLNSNVYALARSTGRLRWTHMFNRPNVGPNGVS
jgi:glucose dehydrogenase